MEADHQATPPASIPASIQASIRARFVADPASVPSARRFVADGLSAWGRDALLEDATLCVSELAGNAALHSESTFMEITVHDLVRAVRLSVEDDGAVPASAVAIRGDLPQVEGGDQTANLDEIDELDRLLAQQPATGRGLTIVSVLARDWGVEALENGKRVWAELTAGDDEDGHHPPGHGSRRADAPAPPEPVGGEVVPPGWTVVRLPGCPVALSVRQDQHLDELIRELKLLQADQDNPDSLELADRLQDVLNAPAHARLEGRRQAQVAIRRGDRLIDVEMAMPATYAGEIRRLDAAVRDADALCERRRLLTLASPPELREFRAWMTEQLLRQLEHDQAPVDWDTWRGDRG